MFPGEIINASVPAGLKFSAALNYENDYAADNSLYPAFIINLISSREGYE